MKRLLFVFLACFAAIAAHAAIAPAHFSGTWIFDPGQSKNVGMMAQGKITTVITQSGKQIIVDDTSVFNGESDTQHTVYDLTGKPISNRSIMAGPATTRSRWEKNRLVTDWESAGAIAGTVTRRIETRYLSPDGKTMYVESAGPGKEPIVMVFTKSK